MSLINSFPESPDISDKVSWSDAETSVKKNLLKNTATTQTVNGVTFTVNSDRTVTVSTASGGATNNAECVLNANLGLANGSYTLYTDAQMGYAMHLDIVASNQGAFVRNLVSLASGNSETFTVDYSDYDALWARIWVRSGQTASGVVKPMIVLSSVQDSTYAPYIPDNAELDAGLKQANSYDLHNMGYSINLNAVCDPNKITKYEITGATSQPDGVGDNPVLYETIPTYSGYLQIAHAENINKLFIRTATDNDGTLTWTPWAKFVQDIHSTTTVTLSTSTTTTLQFPIASLTTDSLVDVAVSEWGLVPDDVTVTTGMCTVIMPKVDDARSVTVSVYLK